MFSTRRTVSSKLPPPEGVLFIDGEVEGSGPVLPVMLASLLNCVEECIRSLIIFMLHVQIPLQDLITRQTANGGQKKALKGYTRHFNEKTEGKDRHSEEEEDSIANVIEDCMTHTTV